MKRLLLLSAVWLAAEPWPALAADSPGITVSGVGESKVKPTLVEFEFRAAGTAELAGDAIVKYRDALRRMSAAFTALKIADLEIKEQDLSYLETNAAANANALALAMAGNQAQPTKSQVQISRGLHVTLANIEKLSEQDLMEHIGKIVDTAKDAGAQSGTSTSNLLARIYGAMAAGTGNPVATFVVPNPEAAREKAYQLAFQQAQARAERLAALAGAKLGRVLSIEEEPLAAAGSPQNAQMQMLAAIYGAGGEAEKPDPASSRIASEKYEEIPVRVTLRVRFEIESK
jgi:uncharacterized protein YggE